MVNQKKCWICEIEKGSDSDDSENEDQIENEENDSDWSIHSDDIRRKRKVFDRKQKRRLDKLRSARGRRNEDNFNFTKLSINHFFFVFSFHRNILLLKILTFCRPFFIPISSEFLERNLEAQEILRNPRTTNFSKKTVKNAFCPFIRERGHLWAFSYKRTPQ